MDTKIRCYTKPEVGHTATKIQSNAFGAFDRIYFFARLKLPTFDGFFEAATKLRLSWRTFANAKPSSKFLF